MTKLLFSLLATVFLCTTTPAQTWRELTPSDGPIPRARFNASATYDPVAHRMVVFGGRTSNADQNDVWAFDLNENSWTEITPDNDGPTPIPRATHNAVYDPDNYQMLIWSGQKLDGGRQFLNDVWAFDLATHTWTPFAPEGPVPLNRYGTAAIFDPLAQTLVTFAGFTDDGRFDDTWTFNPNANAWTDITPSTDRPRKRCLHHAVYDRRDHQMVIYGGQGAGAQKDIWSFDLTTGSWTELTPEDSPPGRWFAASAYDALNHRFLMFGGERLGADGGTTDEVWTFDLDQNAWILLETAGTPPLKRTRPASIYIEAEARMIIFGGAEGTALGDVWALEGLDPPTAVEETQDALPDELALEQNYPNPFNPTTTIGYNLPVAGQVELRIYDALGQPVRRLVGHHQQAGAHTVVWDGTDARGLPVASGVYLYRLSTGQTQQSRRLVLIR
ncbi:MAG: T9SS type A sorting domain-containing protein [Candidatus Latescibacteria bacterium]|nr:T9SS type A sorting domain-containing protein [Candidatus Latescibacterota bacterium]